jgi:hypothetical protein
MINSFIEVVVYLYKVIFAIIKAIGELLRDLFVSSIKTVWALFSYRTEGTERKKIYRKTKLSNMELGKHKSRIEVKQDEDSEDSDKKRMKSFD